MIQNETLSFFEIHGVLSEAKRENAPVIATLMIDGKWVLLDLKICGNSEDLIHFESHLPCQELKHDQPIGVCIHLGYFKYLFDSTVQESEIRGFSCRIALNAPKAVKRIERRAYHRQCVPEDTKVMVTFWHRGYLESSEGEPEEDYWQGRLLNLSAGGARIEVEMAHKKHFTNGQLLGIQFTPMSYQMPLLLETHVQYTEKQSDNLHFRVGVEFLGLEGSPEGRKVLDRILDVISQYEASNRNEHVKS